MKWIVYLFCILLIGFTFGIFPTLYANKVVADGLERMNAGVKEALTPPNEVKVKVPPDPQWEEIITPHGMRFFRAKTPNGWLICTYETTIFMPDGQHEWMEK